MQLSILIHQNVLNGTPAGVGAEVLSKLAAVARPYICHRRSGGTVVSKCEPLLLSAQEAAELLGIGKTLFWQLHSAGRIPLPVKLGRRTLWRREELLGWVRKGCPSRDKWQLLRERVS